MRRYAALWLLPLVLLAACNSNSPSRTETATARGEVESVSFNQTVPVATITTAIRLAGVNTLWNMHCAVKTYKMTYWTVGPDGELTKASAALMMPDVSRSLPLLSIQHGTEVKRSNVASDGPFLTLEGAWGLAAASRGYAVVVPDYLGLGVSEMIHPYHLAGMTASTVVDAISAALDWMKDEDLSYDGRLFLAGYSEGGYATIAAQRSLEQEYGDLYPITASAAMAGAYNMKATARYLVSKNDYISPPYVALMLTAYNRYLDWNRLDDIFKPPYNDSIEDLLDGELGYAAVTLALPNRLDALLTDAFRAAVADSADTQVEAALTANTLLDWAPITPTHLFHGNADNTVPVFNSTSALNAFLLAGAPQVQLTTYNGLNHATAALPAVTDAMTWFEGFWPEG